jgi:hypothetical protein
MSDFLLFTLQPNINLDPNRSLPGTHVDYPHHVHDAIAVDKKEVDLVARLPGGSCSGLRT